MRNSNECEQMSAMQNTMSEFHRKSIEWIKPSTKEHILYEFIFTKFKTGKLIFGDGSHMLKGRGLDWVSGGHFVKIYETVYLWFMYLSIAMSHFNRKAEKRGIYKKKKIN